MRRLGIAWRAGALWLAILLAGVAYAQTEPEPAAADAAREAPTAERLAASREQIAAELAALEAEELAPPERVTLRERLEELDRTLLAHESVLSRGAGSLRDEAQALPQPVSERLADGPPHSLADLDAVLDALADTRERAARLEAAASAAASALESARGELEEAERARRRAREVLESEDAEADPRRLEIALRKRVLDSRLAEAELALRQAERRQTRARLEQAEAEVRALAATAENVRAQLAADPAELEARRSELAKRRFDLERELSALRLDLASADRRYGDAQRRFDADPDAGPALRAETAARRAELTHVQRALALLEAELARLESEQQVWERRQRLAAGGVPDPETESWYEGTAEALAEADRSEALERSRLGELREELASLRRDAESAEPAVARWLSVRAESLERLIALYERELTSLATTRALQRRLLSELERERATLSLAERFSAMRRRAAEIWSFELTSSEDRPITVGKVVSALLVFVIGWFLARGLAWLLGHRILPRLRFDDGAAHAFQSLAFYAMLVVVFLTTLRTVNIPLTAFAVVGGALAIGIGFGSQNVVSNFISGLILLAERPLKVGDLVEVEGVHGVVERIGLRSTRVRTGANIIIIVPNAAFLEQKVVNWTHNDPTVRVKVSVGIVYGAPTREAERIIKEVVSGHPRVQDHPEPLVLFMEFGDNALLFDTVFWIRMRSQMDRMKVESEIRFEIDDRFREAGIVIAFPQRDVHLDTLSPLEVRVVRDGTDTPQD